MSDPKWIVQRAGVKGNYAPGWFALGHPEIGEAGWFPTWHEAQAFAVEQASLAQRSAGLTKSLGRWGINQTHRKEVGDPAATNGRKGLTQAQRLQLRDMHSAGIPVSTIARYFERSPATIHGYLKKVS